MAVGTAVVAPVLGWITMTYRQNVVQSNVALADNAASLARVALLRDAASANGVSMSGDDCTESSAVPTSTTSTSEVATTTTAATTTTTVPTTPGTQVVLVLQYSDNGNSASSTVYRLVVQGDRATLQRRRCDATGLLVEGGDLGDDLREPAGGWASTASCKPRPGYPTDDCGEVTLSLVTRDRTDNITAKLRTGPPR